MIKNLPDNFRITSQWRPDARAYDPSTLVTRFEYRGEMFEATNRMGPGWPMVARPCAKTTLWSASADWENWDQVTEHINTRTK